MINGNSIKDVILELFRITTVSEDASFFDNQSRYMRNFDKPRDFREELPVAKNTLKTYDFSNVLMETKFDPQYRLN